MVSIALFEDQMWPNFIPLSYTRPLFDLKIGPRTTFEAYSGQRPKILLVRRHLADVTKENHKECDINPSKLDSDTLFINSLINPGALDIDKFASVSHTFCIRAGNRLIAAKLNEKDKETMSKSVQLGKNIPLKKLSVDNSTVLELPSGIEGGLISYSWDIIKVLENELSFVAANYDGDDLLTLSPEKARSAGFYLKGGGRALISETALIEEGTVLDTSRGAIVVKGSAKISPSRIEGPAVIDSNAQVKQFSMISSSYIGKHCRVAGEIEHSIFCDFTNKAHSGFVGHSYVGSWVNIGAMTTTSDLKMTYGDIQVTMGREKVNTMMNKLGSFIGDMVKTSIGTLIYSGKRIGVASHIHGLVGYDVPSFTISGRNIGYKDVELEVDSAVRTQRKMMERRGVAMSSAFEELIKAIFKLSSIERSALGIRKARFSPFGK